MKNKNTLNEAMHICFVLSSLFISKDVYSINIEDNNNNSKSLSTKNRTSSRSVLKKTTQEKFEGPNLIGPRNFIPPASPKPEWEKKKPEGKKEIEIFENTQYIIQKAKYIIQDANDDTNYHLNNIKKKVERNIITPTIYVINNTTKEIEKCIDGECKCIIF